MSVKFSAVSKRREENLSKETEHYMARRTITVFKNHTQCLIAELPKGQVV